MLTEEIINGETTDYNVFQTHKCNRKLDEESLKKLEKSIKKKNLLKSKPILVDKEFNVIDGQHRLEVAKRLGIPIPYQINEGCDSHDMVRLNNNQKTWTITDYLNFYCNTGEYPEYIKLKEFIDRERIQLNIGLRLLNSCRTTDFFSRFRNGEYQYPSDKEFTEVMEKKKMIRETIEYIKSKTSGPKIYLTRVTFYGALVDFFNIKSFTYDVFRKKLQYKLDMLHPCSKQAEYLKLFKDIYNWKNHSPLTEEISYSQEM